MSEHYDADLDEDTDQIAFTVGRGGLKIPQLPTTKGRQSSPGDVLEFFQNLWVINDIGEEDDYCNFRVESLQDAEIVLPAEANKPLVVIRGLYKATNNEEQIRQKIANERRSYSDNIVTVGHEEHSILTPPCAMGPFDRWLGVRSANEHGSRSSGFDDHGPYVDFRGEPLSLLNAGPSLKEAVTMGHTAVYEARRQNFSSAIRQALEQTAELLA